MKNSDSLSWRERLEMRSLYGEDRAGLAFALLCDIHTLYNGWGIHVRI